MQPQENPCRVLLGLHGNSTERFILKNLYCLECMVKYKTQSYHDEYMGSLAKHGISSYYWYIVHCQIIVFLQLYNTAMYCCLYIFTRALGLLNNWFRILIGQHQIT